MKHKTHVALFVPRHHHQTLRHASVTILILMQPAKCLSMESAALLETGREESATGVLYRGPHQRIWAGQLLGVLEAKSAMVEASFALPPPAPSPSMTYVCLTYFLPDTAAASEYGIPLSVCHSNHHEK